MSVAAEQSVLGRISRHEALTNSIVICLCNCLSGSPSSFRCGVLLIQPICLGATVHQALFYAIVDIESKNQVLTEVI